LTADIEWTKGSPEEFKKRLSDPRLIAEPARNFLTNAVIFIQGLAREGAPVDTGRLAQSITYRVDSAPMPLWGKVGSNVSYAPDQEYGTNALSEKPAVTGNRPFPTGPQLETWAKRHGAPSGLVVSRAIKRRGGLRPRRYLRNAFKAAQSEVRKFLRQMAKEIEAKWGN
jgi:hypothetical protein